jgi:uncharacterized protein
VADRPLILFAPGAGAPSTSAWMKAWRQRLATLGPVVTLDYPYLRARPKRKAPDPLPRLIEAHRAALARARARHPGRDVVLAGKSMGSRVGCHLAAEEPGLARAVVCLGYPLVGQRGTVRDEVLLALRTPVLFVQGTRDALCPLEHLERVRARMTAPSALHVVETGDHSLLITRAHTKATGVTQEAADEAALAAIGAFVP